LIRNGLSTMKEGMRRFFSGIGARVFFFNHRSKIRKPLHVQYIKKCLKLGKDVSVDSFSRIDFYLKDENKYPSLKLGDRVMISFRCTLLCAEKIEIGADTLIASDVMISDENHGIENPLLSYRLQPLETKPVIIGRNCWIGEKAIILPGVTIGDNSIIGAGSVVTKNIPANSIAVGNPCAVIKRYKGDSKNWVADLKD